MILEDEILFVIKGIEYGLFIANDGHTEIYETKNPLKTGFVFPSEKNLVLFINTLTDIVERKMREIKNEDE